MSLALPNWAVEVIARYESGAAGCFVLHGNVDDRFYLPGQKQSLGNLSEFLSNVLLPRFEVVLTYDLGGGVEVERGKEAFSTWPSLKNEVQLPTQPLKASRFLGRYLTYVRNLRHVGAKAHKVAIILKGAHLMCPSLPNALNYDLHALASVWQSWASEANLAGHGQAIFLLSENLTGLHPLIANHPSVADIEIPLPSKEELTGVMQTLTPTCEKAVSGIEDRLPWAAARLRGATGSAVEDLLLRRHYDNKPLVEEDFSALKKQLVECDCAGLIEFVEPDRSLDGVIGLDAAKEWLKLDLDLWRRDELEAMPMGYLFCGPVGTGKTYLAECLAGEAGVPVVTLKNFRDRWVGSTEANLEKIFSLLHALDRCMVFIDEADQALGKRAAGSGDSGVSSRVYSMIAKEMSNPRNRGKLVWLLASSRPDLIEVDLKRPGRIDVKIPIFPATEPSEALPLLQALSGKRGLKLPDEDWQKLSPLLPELLTPGGAEAMAVKAVRLVKTKTHEPFQAMQHILSSSLPPVPFETLKAQMRLAVKEATESEFVPPAVLDILEP
ncbi:ATP-binding protein [Akkermansiaceae bacterium]|nr:ATP-binding protein [Akkermansiaceae bacterium]